MRDALDDVLLRPALQEFMRSQHAAHVEMLLDQVKKKDRDTMKEAWLAGKVDVYETFMSEIEYFAQRMLKEASE